MRRVTVLYFAWVREKTGRGEETLTVPDGLTTVGDLVGYLRSLGPGYEDALRDIARLRVAVNQVHVDFAHGISDGDEIALFPPVTGGAR